MRACRAISRRPCSRSTCAICRASPVTSCRRRRSRSARSGFARRWSAIPNPTVGYRIEEQGRTAAYLPDHEPALGLKNGRWLEPEWISGYDLAEGADLLIHDAQYTDEEYARCVGWGHSTYRHALEFAARVGAKEVVLFHHDPSHDDEMLERLLADAVRRFKPAFRVSGGCEGGVSHVRGQAHGQGDGSPACAEVGGR